MEKILQKIDHNEMKKIILTILTVVSISSFGQQWSEYQVDSTLTLMLPGNIELRDTLGQQVIKSTIDNGMIIISVIPNSGRTLNVKTQDDLINWYNDFSKGFVNSQKGQLIKDEIIEDSGLKMIRLSFNATLGNEKQVRHCLAIFVNDKIYAINFWEPESLTKEMTHTREQLFSSLRFPTNPGLANQMSYSKEIPRGIYYGALVRRILQYVLLPGLVILIIVWIIKQVRKQSTSAQQ